jgi:hypothetical protein
MSKILDATANASGMVTADGVQVVGAIVLSEGKKASSGVAVIDGDKVWYLTSSATDIKDLIGSMVEIINQIATIATGLDSVTTSPSSQAAAIAQLQLMKTELEQTKELLK